jgi:DNA-binding response OmpR family regulator
MLPDASGIDVCRELRMKGIDSIVLMLTVKSQELDRVLGLEMGADDYMTKPFSLPELLARIRAHLRRAPVMPSDSVSRYRFGDIEIDFKKLLLTRNGKVLEMTAKEFDLMRLLVSARGEVVTRERILEVVWGYQSYPSTRTVDNFILQLRHKLEPERAKPRYILSVYGEGYKFVG